jgi:hypothetical protein
MFFVLLKSGVKKKMKKTCRVTSSYATKKINDEQKCKFSFFGSMLRRKKA